MLRVEYGFQNPYNQIANSLFPNEKIQPHHHNDRGNDIHANSSNEFGLKSKVFVFFINFQFYILPPISS